MNTITKLENELDRLMDEEAQLNNQCDTLEKKIDKMEDALSKAMEKLEKAFNKKMAPHERRFEKAEATRLAVSNKLCAVKDKLERAYRAERRNRK